MLNLYLYFLYNKGTYFYIENLVSDIDSFYVSPSHKNSFLLESIYFSIIHSQVLPTLSFIHDVCFSMNGEYPSSSI